jgi:hypothetical protein
MIKIEGDHNSERPTFMLDSVSIFFYNVLECSKLPLLDESKLTVKDYLMRLDTFLEEKRIMIQKSYIDYSIPSGNSQEDDDYKLALIESIDSH